MPVKTIPAFVAGAAFVCSLLVSPSSAQSPDTPSKSKFEQSFLQSFPMHHQQAIEMAQVCVGKAAHPELKAMCQKLITAQTEQKKDMDGWLRQWYAGKGAAPADKIEKMQAQHEQMMSKLQAASADGFDHEFLKDMGTHHAQGVQEAKECVERAAHGELKRLCGKMASDQESELAKMNGWQQTWK